MTSRHDGKRHATLGALLLGMVLSGSALASPDSDLRRLIDHTPELSRVFKDAQVRAVSATRAEAAARVGQSRHAVVLYRLADGKTGEMYCHAALGRAERDGWMAKLIEASAGDREVADILAAGSSPRIFLKGGEYQALQDWNGWRAGVCAVPESGLKTEYPAVPDDKAVMDAAYRRGKALFALGTSQANVQALEKFRSLRSDPVLYANAMLYIVAILDQVEPDLARQLRERHVHLRQVTDIDALTAYIDASWLANRPVEAMAAEARCQELNGTCG